MFCVKTEFRLEWVINIKCLIQFSMFKTPKSSKISWNYFSHQFQRNLDLYLQWIPAVWTPPFPIWVYWQYHTDIVGVPNFNLAVREQPWNSNILAKNCQSSSIIFYSALAIPHTHSEITISSFDKLWKPWFVSALALAIAKCWRKFWGLGRKILQCEYIEESQFFKWKNTVYHIVS